MVYYFKDLKEEKKKEFLVQNLAEILYRQRKKDNISQSAFLIKYFERTLDKEKRPLLSLSQLKRYEKEYNNNQLSTIPKKNREALNIVKDRMENTIEEIYKEKLYSDLLKKDSQILASKLHELGLLDCIETSANAITEMIDYNKSFNKRTSKNYPKQFLLEWLFVNAKKYLNNEPLAEVIDEGRETRHDIYRSQD